MLCFRAHFFLFVYELADIALEEAPPANNTMSFGVALRGFPVTGQQAFGEKTDSWGIFNNRSDSGAGEPSKVYIDHCLLIIRLVGV